MTGPVRQGVALENYRAAVVLACANALTAARALLAPDEQIATILSLSLFISAEPGFTAHSRLADYASDYLKDEMGINGIGARMALGAASLPGDAPVEIRIIAAV